MSYHARVSSFITVCLALGGCGLGTVLGPIQAEEVTVTLEVSGGFAGMDYAITIDGASGEVRGVRCVSFCDFVADEVIVALSQAQIADLADRLDASGILDIAGRDYGMGCCDLFHYVLTYVRGTRAASVSGTQDRLPPAVVAVAQHLNGLARRRVPLLMSADTRDTDWPRDAYELGTVTVQGLELVAEVSFGGGCASHPMDLVAWGGWLESFPVQINALITHDDNEDPCDAYLTQERTFDLLPLRDAYVAAYGAIAQERPVVILRLWDPQTQVVRIVEVEL